MAHNLEWIEELLSFVETTTTTMATKVDSITDPDRYRTTDALGLVKNSRDGGFFSDVQSLLDKLEEAECIAGRLTSAIDSYLEECEKKS